MFVTTVVDTIKSRIGECIREIANSLSLFLLGGAEWSWYRNSWAKQRGRRGMIAACVLFEEEASPITVRLQPRVGDKARRRVRGPRRETS